MTKLIHLCAALVALAPGMSDAQRTLPLTEMSIGMYRIEAEVAATDAARQQGLMHRKTMADNHGMVFVYGMPFKHCMWMRNTLLPLSVAFIDAHGKIINIEDMQPQSDQTHCAARDARYALEMNLGWFKSRGFGPGATVSGLPNLSSAQ